MICGCPIFDYEHIEPEWKDSKSHDPTKMTILCGNCQDKVTRKQWSKQKVWMHMIHPYNSDKNHISDTLDFSYKKRLTEHLLGNLYYFF